MFKEPENRGRINFNITKTEPDMYMFALQTLSENRCCRDRHAAKMPLKIV